MFKMLYIYMYETSVLGVTWLITFGKGGWRQNRLWALRVKSSS